MTLERSVCGRSSVSVSQKVTMDEATLVVIGQHVCDTSRGCLAVGEYARLPFTEAIQLSNSSMVSLAEHSEQFLDEPVQKRRYQRRDMQAEP